MEIYKTKRGEFRYRTMIWSDSRAIKSPVFKRKTDCHQWLSEKNSERARLKLYGDHAMLYEKITVAEYAIKWLKTKEAQGVSPSTLTNYERYVRVHIVPMLGKLLLRDVKKSDIESLQISLKKNHNSKGVNIIMTALKGLFRESMREGYILKNPCEFIKALSSDIFLDQYWTTNEIHQFLQANQSSDHYELFLVALNTGMRKGELAGLCWDRVNFAENTIIVSRTRTKSNIIDRTKTKLKRIIPMNGMTRATLLNLFKFRSNDAGIVFLNKNNAAIDPHHIYREFHKAQKKAKIDNVIRFHDTRHTFASQFMLQGGNIYDLQKILGHTSVVMTQRYAHLSDAHLQNALSKFELGSLKDENVLLFKPKLDEFNQKLTNSVSDAL